MSDSIELEAAAARARLARVRLQGTARALRGRLEPGQLLEDATDTVRTGATDLALTTANVARERPGMVFGSVVAGIAFLARRPLWRLVRRIVRRR